jgi:hypothetical protein
MNLIEIFQELMNLNRDLLIALGWQSTQEMEFEIQIWGFLNFCLKIQMLN